MSKVFTEKELANMPHPPSTLRSELMQLTTQRARSRFDERIKHMYMLSAVEHIKSTSTIKHNKDNVKYAYWYLQNPEFETECKDLGISDFNEARRIIRRDLTLHFKWAVAQDVVKKDKKQKRSKLTLNKR